MAWGQMVKSLTHRLHGPRFAKLCLLGFAKMLRNDEIKRTVFFQALGVVMSATFILFIAIIKLLSPRRIFTYTCSSSFCVNKRD